MPHTNAHQALCTHTHLFPGARCRVQGLPHPETFAAAPEPIDGVVEQHRVRGVHPSKKPRSEEI